MLNKRTVEIHSDLYEHFQIAFIWWDMCSRFIQKGLMLQKNEIKVFYSSFWIFIDEFAFIILLCVSFHIMHYMWWWKLRGGHKKSSYEYHLCSIIWWFKILSKKSFKFFPVSSCRASNKRERHDECPIINFKKHHIKNIYRSDLSLGWWLSMVNIQQKMISDRLMSTNLSHMIFNSML